MYCLGKLKEVSTAKGVNIWIEFTEYENVLFNKKLMQHKMKRIQSKLDKSGPYDVWKISLSRLDDKR